MEQLSTIVRKITISNMIKTKTTSNKPLVLHPQNIKDIRNVKGVSVGMKSPWVSRAPRRLRDFVAHHPSLASTFDLASRCAACLQTSGLAPMLLCAVLLCGCSTKKVLVSESTQAISGRTITGHIESLRSSEANSGGLMRLQYTRIEYSAPDSAGHQYISARTEVAIERHDSARLVANAEHRAEIHQRDSAEMRQEAAETSETYAGAATMHGIITSATGTTKAAHNAFSTIVRRILLSLCLVFAGALIYRHRRIILDIVRYLLSIILNR